MTAHAAAEPVDVALERLDPQTRHRFLPRRGPLSGGLAEQLLNIGLAVEVNGRVQPLRAAVLLFADEPGSLLARENTATAVERLIVILMNHERPSAWDEVSDWLDRHGTIANADVDTLKASKLLAAWRDQELLAALPGRAKRNMAYAKQLAPPMEEMDGLFSTAPENNREE